MGDRTLLISQPFALRQQGTRLRMELDKIPLWRGNHVKIKQLAEDFASYPYLARLTGPSVLMDSINSGLRILTGEQESFAYADSFDDAENRYSGLHCGQPVKLSEDALQGLLVKPDIAAKQYKEEIPPLEPPREQPREPPREPPRETPKKQLPKRFHGTVTLDTTRMGRDAGQIAEEVVAHLSGLFGSTVTVTLEIEAEVPSGVPEQVIRIVMENAKALKFVDQGFEQE